MHVAVLFRKFGELKVWCGVSRRGCQRERQAQCIPHRHGDPVRHKESGPMLNLRFRPIVGVVVIPVRADIKTGSVRFHVIRVAEKLCTQGETAGCKVAELRSADGNGAGDMLAVAGFQSPQCQHAVFVIIGKHGKQLHIRLFQIAASDIKRCKDRRAAFVFVSGIITELHEGVLCLLAAPIAGNRIHGDYGVALRIHVDQLEGRMLKSKLRAILQREKGNRGAIGSAAGSGIILRFFYGQHELCAVTERSAECASAGDGDVLTGNDVFRDRPA